MRTGLPRIGNESELEDFLSAPSGRAVEAIGRMEGELAILGAAGKVGITLALMVARAARESGNRLKVYAASRFSEPGTRERLETAGVETRPCDLLDEAQVRGLPEARRVIFLAGRKFGTEGERDLTWATNTLAPANVARRYAKSDILAYSTGCVYDFATAASGGSPEGEEPRPTGEYAQSALGRERVFEYYSRSRGTRVCLFRLNYAIDLRYGVLRDLADRVFEGRPVELSTASFNCIWQGDVLERTILALELCSSPPSILNVTGPETVSVRWAAEEFGKRFGRKPVFAGEEDPASRAYLSNAAASFSRFGYPSLCLEDMIDLVADWVASGGSSLGKPTHFESKDGRY